MGKKSRRNRQKNPEQFKKNQQNAIKKQNTECWYKTRAQGIYAPCARLLDPRARAHVERHFRDVIRKTTLVQQSVPLPPS
tara:strand:+ start:400 stop:639 length:240 start_codon:yes stop_codon:yes gene_type:complete